jgi:hypothetical protein
MSRAFVRIIILILLLGSFWYGTSSRNNTDQLKKLSKHYNLLKNIRQVNNARKKIILDKYYLRVDGLKKFG